MLRNVITPLLFLWVFALSAFAELRPVRLILKWDHQFQFAGYYAAQWQGFYAEEGLDVQFIPRPQKDHTLLTLKDEINQGRADFAVGGPNILQDIDKGNEFVLLSSVFQRSPFSFIVLANSSIYTLPDLHSACIESTKDFGDLEFRTLMHKEGLPIEKIKWKKFSFGLEGIISKQCEAVIDYSISANWVAKEKGVSIRELKSEQFGVNFYGDVLYSSKKLVDENPFLAERFRRASMRGWNYAMENPEAISNRIEEEFDRVFKYDDHYAYNMMSYNAIKELMNYPLVEAGHSNLDRWGKIQMYLYDIGETNKRNLPEWFLFDFSKYEILENDKKNNRALFLVFIFLLVSLFCYFLYFKHRRESERLETEREELIENQDLLYAVLDLIPMSVFWKDKESRYLGSNKAFMLDAGVDPDGGIRGKKDSDLPWKDQADSFVEDDRDILSGKKSTEPYEERQDREDGSVEWLRTRKVSIKNNEGSVVGVLGAYQSITEFKQAFENLDAQKKTSETLLRRFKGLIKSSPDMIFYKDYSTKKGEYLICNVLFEEWVGKLEFDVIGKKDGSLFDGEMSSEFERDDSLVIESRKPLIKEFNVKTASGKRVLYELNRIPVFSKMGGIDGILGIGRDITEKRDLESIYKALFTVTNDAYFILSEDGAIENCNDKASEFLGVDHKANLIGMRLIRDFTPEFQTEGRRSEDVVKYVNQKLKESKDGYCSASFIHRDIDSNSLYVDVFLARIGDGQTLVQWHDISESKEKQEQLELAKKEAEALAEAKSLFLANMSHEIRTPLNAIVGLGGMLKKSEDSAKIELYIDSINQSSHHLLNVVNDILDYSKLDADKMTIELVSIDMFNLFSQIKGMYEKQALDKGVELNLEISQLPKLLMSDPTKLKQILSNLVSNAIKFCPRGSVEVGGAVNAGKLKLWVKDDGVGIENSRMNKLFEPFTQEDESTTRKFGGTGLGLSICKGLAVLLGGEINVSSNLGVGTKFTLVLPYVEVADSQAVEQLKQAPDLAGFSILIAEDNALNQLVIEELLLETKVNVVLVANGLEALNAVAEQEFDLILMDIQMPIMDGIEATKKLRENNHFTGPIIALTANTGEAEKRKSFESGMDDFLTKPIDQPVLFTRLNKWLND